MKHRGVITVRSKVPESGDGSGMLHEVTVGHAVSKCASTDHCRSRPYKKTRAMRALASVLQSS